MTPGTNRATASMTATPATSPPATTKSPKVQLAIDQVVGDSLVHPLVAPAQQRKRPPGGQLDGRHRLVEAPPGGAQQVQRAGAASSPQRRGTPAPAPAPCRPHRRMFVLLHRPVRISRGPPQVVNPQVNNAGPPSPSRSDSRVEPGINQPGKNREHINS